MFKFPSLCRLCLIPSDNSRSVKIFDETNEIPEKILELTNIQVVTADGLPEQICVLCRAQLDLSVVFRRQVLTAESMLRDHFAQFSLNSSSPPLITGDPLSEVRRIKGREGEAEAESEVCEGEDTVPQDWMDIAIKVEEETVIAEAWPELDLTALANADDIDKNKDLDGKTEEQVRAEGGDEENLDRPVSTSQEIKQEIGEKSTKKDNENIPHNEEEKVTDETNEKKQCNSVRCGCELCCDNNYKTIESEESSEDEWRCDLCLDTFETASLLRKHRTEHGDPVVGEWHKCPHCDKTFPSQKGLCAHQRQHPKPQSRPQRTSTIKVQTPTVQPQPQTERKAEGEGVRRSSRPSKAPERHVVPHYSCTKCERMYNDLATLENHMNTHLGISYKCNHCGKKFNSKELLAKHIQSSHIEKLRLRSRVNVCDVCGKSFENRSHLFSHMRSHKSLVRLCEVCGKTVSLNTYSAHKRTHLNASSQEVFQCDVCEKKFNNKMSLRTHKNSYHGTPKFTCEVCGKQFTTMALMKHHQYIHLGKRDHVCQVCGRAFTLKVTLKSHMRIHTGETPYTCDHCGRSFTWKTTYRNHINSCKGGKTAMSLKSRNNTNNEPKLEPPMSLQPLPPSIPQDLPIDYSEETKYEVPVGFREEQEAKYRHFLSMEPVRGFPLALNLTEEIKYNPQEPVNFAGEMKPYVLDFKSPV